MDVKLKRVAKFAEEYGFTEASLRWMIFNAKTNGLAASGAIVRIGRAVFLRPDKFDAWIESQQAKAA